MGVCCIKGRALSNRYVAFASLSIDLCFAKRYILSIKQICRSSKGGNWVSDILLGAVISGLSLFIGSAIGAFISYKTTKAQIETRLVELQQELGHREREARRGRLIEARKNYLVPLRETVSKWAVELTRMIDQVDSVGRLLKMHEQYAFLHPKPARWQKPSC